MSATQRGCTDFQAAFCMLKAGGKFSDAYKGKSWDVCAVWRALYFKSHLLRTVTCLICLKNLCFWGLFCEIE